MRTLIISLIVLGLAIAQEVVSKKVDRVPLDPFDRAWEGASAVEVPLAGQAVTTPMELKPTVSKLIVKSINYGKYIGFLLIW